MELKIEKGIPRPTGWSKWAEFEVGDSAFIDASEHIRAKVSASQWGSQQTPRRRFSMRRVDGGYRIWRID